MRRELGMTAAVLAVLTAGGCTGPSQDAVPTAADSPYVCAGVQRRGAELALGGDVVADRESGTWGGYPVGFNCAVDGPSGATILVNEKPSEGSGWGSNDSEVLATLAEQGNAAKIDADAPGAGYAFGGSSAGWVCDQRFVLVELLDAETEGRDHAADAERLLVSMLPWACDGADVPTAS
jgi:hypothetical protein